MSLATLYGETQDTYLTLIRTCPFRPLRSEADLDEAMAILDGLVVKDTLSAPEADYLAVLSDLVEQYEAEVASSPPRLRCGGAPASAGGPVHDPARGSPGDRDRRGDARGGAGRDTTADAGADWALARHFQVSPSVFVFGE